MARPKSKPLLDLEAVLNKHVNVRIGGEVKSISPYEAEMEQCASKALGGDMSACRRFIYECLSQKLITKPEVVDDWNYLVIIPPDYTNEEFDEKLTRLGPPPWPGKRDGLTAEARKEWKAKQRRKR